MIATLLQVNHSQRMREMPLIPWVIAEANGRILAAHCDCMAGLGETCSHVASLLWDIAAGVDKRDSAMPPSIISANWQCRMGQNHPPKCRKSLLLAQRNLSTSLGFYLTVKVLNQLSLQMMSHIDYTKLVVMLKKIIFIKSSYIIEDSTELRRRTC